MPQKLPVSCAGPARDFVLKPAIKIFVAVKREIVLPNDETSFIPSREPSAPRPVQVTCCNSITHTLRPRFEMSMYINRIQTFQFSLYFRTATLKQMDWLPMPIFWCHRVADCKRIRSSHVGTSGLLKPKPAYSAECPRHVYWTFDTASSGYH